MTASTGRAGGPALDDPPQFATGTRFEATRSFTVDEVRAFAALTGDIGTHHLVADATGRVMVHGLLTASLATRLGGEIDYVARTMVFRFKRPVWTDEAITCRLEITSAENRGDRWALAMAVRFVNPAGELVLEAESDGIVRLASP